MYTYLVYGLGICSELALPELVHSDQGCDILIRFGEIRDLPPEYPNHFQHWVRYKNDRVVLSWKGIGAFLVLDGKEIIIDPSPTVTEDRIRLFLLGGVLGITLQMRGYLVYHASGVAYDNEAVVFLGKKGHGKSTLAAALHSQGYDLLTDDVLAIDMFQNHPFVSPGYPQLKLWADSSHAIGLHHEELVKLHPYINKRSYQVKSGSSISPSPLRQVYVLGHGDKLGLERLSSLQAFRAMMPHWYCLRFGLGINHFRDHKVLFLRVVDLINQVPIYLLRRPKTYPNFTAVVQLINHHIQSN